MKDIGLLGLIGDQGGRKAFGPPEHRGVFSTLSKGVALGLGFVIAFLALSGFKAGAVDIANSDVKTWGTDVPADTALSDVAFTEAATGDVADKIAALRTAISTYKTIPSDTNRQAVLNAMAALPASVITNQGINIGALRFDDDAFLAATADTADQRLDVGTGAANFDVAAGKTVTIAGNTYIANAEAGGALFVGAGGLFAKTGDGAIVFDGNAAGRPDPSYVYAHGGAVYNKGTVSLNDSVVFSNNTSTGYGGAINNDQGVITFSGNADFIGNTGGSGGAIRNLNGTVILAGETTFKNNTAEYFGGAIDNQGANSVLILSGKTFFIGNGGDAHGAAVYNTRGIVDISGETIFENNSTTGNSTLENTYGTLNISGPVTFINNTGYAGAMDITGDSTSRTNLTGSVQFIDNNARGKGGAIYIIWAPVNLIPIADETILFSGNQANGVANSIHISQDGTLVAGGGGTVDMRDPMTGEASSRHNTLPITITKSGTGVWKLGGSNSFIVESSYPNARTQLTVSDGTLHLYRAGEVDNGRNGAVQTGSISLAGPGAFFTLGANGTLSVGGSGHSIAAPTINLNNDTTLAFDLARHDANAATEMLTLTGNVSAGTGLGIDLLSLNKTAGTYTLVSDGTTDYTGSVNPNVTYRGINLTGSGTRADGVVTLSATGTNDGKITVIQTGAVTNEVLTWTGNTNGNWDVTTQNWDDGGATTFWDGDAVIFDASATEKDVAILSGRPTVAAMDVAGGDYSFSGEGIIADPSVSNLVSAAGKHGKLKISSGASVDFTGISDENSFMNGVELAGKLTIADKGQLGAKLSGLTFTGTAPTAISTAATALNSAITAYAAAPTPANLTDLQGKLTDYNTAVGTTQTAKTLGTLAVTESATFTATMDAADQWLDVGGNAASIDVATGKTLTISGNSTDSHGGGALNLASGGLFAKTGDGTVVFHANSALDGGALYNNRGMVSMVGPAIFTNNTSNSGGGAIFSYDGSVLLDGPATFATNTTAGSGGAIHNSTKTMTLTGPVTFTDNKSTDGGGAIYNINGVTIMSGGTNFTNNSSTTKSGGAIYNTGGTVTLGGVTTFESNSSINEGGAIYSAYGSMNLNGSTTFANNTTTGYGGALYAAISTVNLSTSVTTDTILFTGNQANNISNSVFLFGNTTMNISGVGSVDMRDSMGGNAYTNTITIAKSDTGTWNLGGSNIFTTAGTGKTEFAVSGGTLHLYRTGEVDNGRNGAVETGSISLAGDDSSFTLGATAKLSVGGSGHAVAAPTITLTDGSTLAFDLAYHSDTATTPMLTLTGTTVTPGTALNVDLLSLKGVGAYTLASAGTTDFSAATDTSLLTYRGSSLTGTRLEGAVVLDTSTAGSLILNQISLVGNKTLTWTGSTDGAWDYSTDNWYDGSAASTFFDGDAVVFPDGIANDDITVRAGGVIVAGMEITGGDYTFDGGAIESATATETTLTGAAHSKKLTVSGTGSATFNNSLDFANGYDIAATAGMTFAGASIKGGVANAGTFTFDVDTNETVAYADILSGSGGYVKNSAGTLVLSGANTYSGSFTVNVGTLKAGAANTFSAAGVHNLANAAVLDLAGYNQTIAGLNGDLGTLVTLGSAVLTLNQTNDLQYAGAISGTGGVIKEGNGKLTLTGTNTYSGTTTVLAGTLALAANGSIADTSLVLGANATLDIFNFNGTGNPTLAGFEAAKGSFLTTDFKTLDMTGGKNLVFDLDGVLAGETVLNVTGNGLLIDEFTKVALKNADPNLQVNDHVILADIATGAVSAAPVTSGRWNFALSLTGGELWATIAGISSYVEATNTFLGPLAPGNANIRNGGAYLDWLAERPFGNTPDINALDDYFTDITANLAPPAGDLELQRFYGAYSAYANQALSSDMNRFRQRWRKQNHFFIDGFVFSGLLPVTADADIASNSAPASPAYGARQCVPAGRSRVWAGGFGSWSKQDSRSGFAGYKYDSYGLALGYDYTRDRLKLGVAAAYSRGDLKVNDLGYKNEADVLNLALHAAYVHESGFYAEGGLGYGHAWNDYRAAMLLGGRKTGDYGSDAFSADLEMGYIARLARGFNLVPSVGVEYDLLRNGSWSESVSGGNAPANRFDSGRDHSLDIPLGLRINRMFRFGRDGYVVPEARAAFVYTANKSRPSIQSGFVGAPGGMRMRGVEPGRSHWRLGAGLSGRLNSRVDIHLEYEYETRSGFNGHNLNASLELSF